MTKAFLTEKNWFRLFELGIFLKALNGFLELTSGILILTFSKNIFSWLFALLARGELIEDPDDRFLNFVANILQHFSGSTRIFAGVYILVHGLINIFLAANLYKKRLWSYLVCIGFLIIFIIYQIYRISYTYSIVLSVVTLWDIIFIFVTWHEYKKARHRQ